MRFLSPVKRIRYRVKRDFAVRRHGSRVGEACPLSGEDVPESGICVRYRGTGPGVGDDASTGEVCPSYRVKYLRPATWSLSP